MRLFEIFDSSVVDTNPENEIPQEFRQVDVNPKKTKEKKSTRTIKNLVKLKKKESNPEQSETPHQYNLGGHISTFLNR